MTKAEVFEVTYHKYLEQIAEIDLVSRAGTLGAQMIDQALEIPFYGKSHTVSKVGVVDAAGKKATFAVSVLLCCYVLQCLEIEPDPGEWVTYREFKNAGPLVGYFTTNTNKIIETTFAGRLDALKSACLRMGGTLIVVPEFDVAVMFEMLPRIPMFFRFNDRDDLFPAQASILFRQSAEKYLDMECLAVGGTYLTGLLIGEDGRESSI